MDKDKVLQQLVDAWAVTPIRDDELTIKDISEALRKAGSKHSKDFVHRRVTNLLDVGVLQRREVRVNGSSQGLSYAYSPADGKTWEDVLQYIKVN